MAIKTNEILTIEELAVYLKIPKSTLYKLVREGKIPSQKVGRHWRFSKRSIDQWFENSPNEALTQTEPLPDDPK